MLRLASPQHPSQGELLQLRFPDIPTPTSTSFSGQTLREATTASLCLSTCNLPVASAGVVGLLLGLAHGGCSCASGSRNARPYRAAA